MQKEKVQALLEDALQQKESLFLIDFNIQAANHIVVIIDGDEGVTVNDCIEVSRAIEHSLDRETEDFSLDVMSAGVSEGLRHIRQYPKNIGRKLQVQTADETIEGTLVAVEEGQITLQWKAREPKPIGKGKITVQKEAKIALDTIKKAQVMITFN